jgi:recombination protein RecT
MTTNNTAPELKDRLKDKADGKAPAKTDSKKAVMMDLLRRMQPQFEAALPSHIKPERLIRTAMTALRQNAELTKCSPVSVLGGVMTAAQLGLEINVLGQAYLLPFNNRQTGQKEAQFIIGYQGLVDLMYRTGRVQTVFAEVVCKNDKFEYRYGLNETLDHVPAEGERGELKGAYAYLKWTVELTVLFTCLKLRY